MTRDYRQYLSLLIFSVVALPANAVPIQLLDVNRLEAASSVILVGKIASVQQTTKAVGQFGSQAVASFEMRADLIVQRVIKGAVNADHVDLWFYKPDEPAPYHDIRSGDSGIFFLHEDYSRLYVVEPMYPFVPSANDCADPPTTAVIDRLVVELRCVAVEGQKIPGKAIDAVIALDTILTEGASEALQLAANSSDLYVRLRSIAALLKRGDVTNLPTIENILMQPVPASLRSSVDWISNGILVGVRNPAVIPILERLARAPDVKVRRAAVQALRNTKSASAIRGLAGALTDPDHWVRYQAVIGLGEITGQDEWSPSIDSFDQNEALFLSYWRAWSQNHDVQ